MRCRPCVWLVGEHAHAEFDDAVAVLRADADVTLAASSRTCPELIVVAQSRPGVVDSRTIEQLRRSAPLAAVAMLLGSWCEGQARASRPNNDAVRLYWYEFPPWWRRQMAMRVAGGCPDWARPERVGNLSTVLPTRRNAPDLPRTACHGMVALATPRWDSAEALADVFLPAGYSTLWHSPGRSAPAVRGVAAGIWDGAQLDEREAADLEVFCRQMAAHAAPVVALLDFPRRDRCAVSRQIGVAAVLGKPWINADLISTIERLAHGSESLRAA